MMEAAALKKCTIFGPYAFNFTQTVDALLDGEGAIMVKNRNELYEVMRKCLLDSAMSQRIANNGQEVIRKNQGATVASMNAIAKILR
jgi:3-deoxy-D-manno-octulosonic-acid transferase